MEKIVIKLEYKCFPVWIYNNNVLQDNGLVEELEGDSAINELLVDIQNKFDALFIDDGIEFCYIGFSNEADKEMLQKCIAKAAQYIEDKIGDKYIIEQEVDFL